MLSIKNAFSNRSISISIHCMYLSKWFTANVETLHWIEQDVLSEHSNLHYGIALQHVVSNVDDTAQFFCGGLNTPWWPTSVLTGNKRSDEDEDDEWDY